ncbi:hypothetical protein GCM10027516_22190 [Niabella aquatica]
MFLVPFLTVIVLFTFKTAIMFDVKEKELMLQSKALQIVIPQYRTHTQLFDNMVRNITGLDALKRINNTTNHFIWITGNMVNTRYWLANILGVEDKDPNETLFKDAKALDTSITYPELEELRKQWHRVSPQLYDKLHRITDEYLAQPYNLGMGIDFVEENILNAVGMAMDRESYLLGQLGIMRRALGYEGVKYDFSDEVKY